MWPWRRRVAEAEQRLAEAEEQIRDTDKHVQKAQSLTAALNRVVEKNHFTELLAAAMQRGT